ncbi:hypothetical protein G9A89_016682 [Geosiphon pyriformis]|nr:hypothetical protein G9A89_016682 [Geosiphon pyriformis]
MMPKIQLNDWMILKEQPLQTSMIMNTSSKSLVAISKTPLLPGFHKKPMLVLNKKLLDGPQQILEKTTSFLLSEESKVLTEEQKIHFFTKGLGTDLSYALWPLLALKDNPIMNMAIELAQRIENNQRMHLGSTLLVFAPASIMASTSQMVATSFAAQTQDPNEQLIDRLTANLAQLLKPLIQALKLVDAPPKGESASQPEENLFYAFNLTDDDHDMNELAINISEPTRKKKKAKVDFVLNPNKASTFAADNNEPPKIKVFKNPPKLEPPEIVQKSEPYSVVKDLIEIPAHITFGQLMTHPQFRKDLCKFLIPKKKTPKTNKCSCQAGLADNSNVISLICKAQVAGYFIDLILNSGSSVSVIAKHFLEAIGRKIDEPFTRPMTNIHGVT